MELNDDSAALVHNAAATPMLESMRPFSGELRSVRTQDFAKPSKT